MHGITLNGWAVQYISGREKELPEIQHGDWLTRWEFKRVSDEMADATFAFEREQQMCFERESQARQVSEYLRTENIETRVVKVGSPSLEFADSK